MQPNLSAEGQIRRMAFGQSVPHFLRRSGYALCTNVLLDDLESLATLRLAMRKELPFSVFLRANFNFCTFST
jgi:hypothetical protein